MGSKRIRYLVSEASILSFKPSVRLQFDALRNKFVVLGPEHVYWPDEVSVAILEKLDGTRKVGDIINALAIEFDTQREAIITDVTEFLQNWSDEQLIAPIRSP